LMFAKVYASEQEVHTRLVGNLGEKTFCKCNWIFLQSISKLEKDVVSHHDIHCIVFYRFLTLS
jgi:hypothetical protein